jgi:thioredoxin
MIQMNSELFQKHAMESQQLTLVEFWAPWCVYCRRIIPAMERISQQYAGELVIGQVNIDDEPLLAHQEDIEVIPTLVLYRGGKALGSIVAPDSKARIEEFIREAKGN